MTSYICNKILKKNVIWEQHKYGTVFDTHVNSESHFSNKYILQNTVIIQSPFMKITGNYIKSIELEYVVIYSLQLHLFTNNKLCP